MKFLILIYFFSSLCFGNAMLRALLGAHQGGGGGSVAVDCTLATPPPIGSLCTDGTYFAGSVTIVGPLTYKLATMPGGCGYEPLGGPATVATASFTPVCAGSDAILKQTNIATNIAGTDLFDYLNSSFTALSYVPGDTSSAAIMAAISSPAVSYCKYLNYGGHTDWFLPNQTELSYIFCRSQTSGITSTATPNANCVLSGYGTAGAKIPGMNRDPWWTAYVSSSVMYSANMTVRTTMDATAGEQTTSTSPYNIRCVRKIP
jgi:hypothetical protein